MKLKFLIIALLFCCLSEVQAQPFITIWKSDNPGVSNNNQITFNAQGDFNYVWKEVGNPSNTGSGFSSGGEPMTLTFSNAGTYELSITPTGATPFHRFFLTDGTSDQNKIIKVTQWGNISWSSMADAFLNAVNLDITTTDFPNLSAVTSLERMFYNNSSLVANSSFSSWNVGNVTNMKAMFYGAKQFNQPLNNWNMSKVVSMNSMFFNASIFNQPVNDWNVSKVQDMGFVFAGTKEFDQPLSTWNVSAVTEMSGMFNMAEKFNQPLNSWNVSNVTNMNLMFESSVLFNQPLNNWNVGNVVNMSRMFYDAKQFNQPINSWNVSKVSTMVSMFDRSSKFNQPLNNWNVSAVTNMYKMFSLAHAFNQDLNSWNVSNVTNMGSMFEGASSFNQALNSWNLNNVTSMSSMFRNSGLSCENYGKTIRGWAINPNTKTGVNFTNQTGMTYGALTVTERNNLINNKSWNISGDAYNSACECTLELKNINESICQGGAYTKDGQNYTQAGTYTYLKPSIIPNNCDTSITLTLSIKPNQTKTVNASVCQGQSYTIDGHTYTTAGTHTYTKTSTNPSACDTAVTVNLTINPIQTKTVNASVCIGQSYTIDGHTYTTAGTHTYTKTSTNPSACDTAVTVNLTIKPIQTKTVNASVCQGQSYTIDGHIYTTAGTHTYTKTSTNPSACDTAVTVNLTIQPIQTKTVNAIVCQGESYTIDGHIYTTAGTHTYTKTSTNPSACDTAVTVNLTIQPIQTKTITASICQGQTYTIDGHTYTTAGTYTYTKTSTNPSACDTAVTVNLTIQPIQTKTVNAIVCQGESYTIDGHIYTTAGTHTYTKTSTNPSACDTAVTVNLTIQPIQTKTITASICQGQTYTIDGHTYTTAGTYTYTKTSTNPSACDTAVTVNLTINPIQTKTITASVCQGQTYTIDGHTYSTAGIHTYTKTSTNPSACDTAVTVNLTIKPIQTKTITASICQGQTYTIDGHTYSTAGTHTYTKTSTNPSACDTAVTVNLTINPIQTKTVNPSICQGQTYTIDGNTYITAGTHTYTKTSTNPSACDTAVTVNLTIQPIQTKTVNASVCIGQSYTIDGHTYSTSGTHTYTKTSTNPSACDTAVTVNLTINPIQTKTVNASVCQGQSYTIDGHTYTTAGTHTYTKTSTNPSACDTAVTVNLTIKPIQTQAITASVCQGQSYTIDGHTYSTAGTHTYTKTSTNPSACDTAVTVNLTIQPIQTKTVNASVCIGQSYTIDGHTYTTAGTHTYTKTSTNPSACDTAVTFNLTIQPIQTKTVNANVCIGQSYTIDGHTYTTAGTHTYTKTSTNPSACDTTVTVNLTINPIQTKAITASVCQGQSYTIDGHIYTTAGTHTYTKTSTNPSACDTAVTVNLTIQPIQTKTVNASVCIGQSYTIDGHTYTTAGTHTYTKTSTNPSACDTTVTVNLTINPIQTKAITASVCQGQSYTIDGHIYTTAGTHTYTKTSTNPSACDTAVTVNLTIQPIQTKAITASVCQGQSYTIDGHTYSTAGTHTYTKTSTNPSACDTAVTVNLTFKPIQTQAITASVCQGQSYTIDGHTYSTAGTYTYTKTSTNPSACDTAVTVNLTINPIQTKAITASVCQGQTYTIDGHTYTTAGTYTYTKTSTNPSACDTAVTVNLTIQPIQTKAITASVCQGQSYTIDGHTYTTAGTHTYTKTSTNPSACDTAVTVNLSFNPIQTKVINASVCQGESYTIDGHTYSTAGTHTYTKTSTNPSACDTAVTVNLTIKPIQTQAITASVCQGQSYTIDGHTYSTAGTYTYTKTSTNPSACDTAVTVNLTIQPIQTKAITASVCQGQSYTIDGHTYTTAGTHTYTKTSTNPSACDTAVTVNLSFNPIQTKVINASVCQGESYTIDGHTYSTAGTHTYTKTSTNPSACDTAVTVNLTIKPIQTKAITASVCQGQSYTIDGHTYTTAGTHTYTKTSTNPSACDTAVTVNLTIKPIQTQAITASVCQGQSYTIDGHTYSTAGTHTYTKTSTNPSACDTAVTVNLSFNPIQTKVINASVCQGESYTIDGHTYSQTGTYNYTKTSANLSACDTLVTIKLIVKSIPTKNITQVICEGETYSFNGHTYITSGTYRDTLKNKASNGCDSIVITNLKVNKVTLKLTASPSQASYGEQVKLDIQTASVIQTAEWSPDNNLSDKYSHNPTLTVMEPSWYVVKVSDDYGCEAMDSIFVGIDNDKGCFFLPNTFTPNGNSRNDVFRPLGKFYKELIVLRIFDRWGKVIFETNDINIGWDGTFQGHELPPGVYFYYLEGTCIDGKKQFIKGDVSLIR